LPEEYEDEKFEEKAPEENNANQNMSIRSGRNQQSPSHNT